MECEFSEVIAFWSFPFRNQVLLSKNGVVPRGKVKPEARQKPARPPSPENAPCCHNKHKSGQTADRKACYRRPGGPQKCPEAPNFLVPRRPVQRSGTDRLVGRASRHRSPAASALSGCLHAGWGELRHHRLSARTEKDGGLHVPEGPPTGPGENEPKRERVVHRGGGGTPEKSGRVQAGSFRWRLSSSQVRTANHITFLFFFCQ